MATILTRHVIIRTKMSNIYLFLIYKSECESEYLGSGKNKLSFIYLHNLTLLCVIFQVRTLQLERDQSQMLLENVQQRHKQDMEIMESAHK